MSHDGPATCPSDGKVLSGCARKGKVVAQGSPGAGLFVVGVPLSIAGEGAIHDRQPVHHPLFLRRRAPVPEGGRDQRDVPGAVSRPLPPLPTTPVRPAPLLSTPAEPGRTYRFVVLAADGAPLTRAVTNELFLCVEHDDDALSKAVPTPDGIERRVDFIMGRGYCDICDGEVAIVVVPEPAERGPRGRSDLDRSLLEGD